MARRRPRSGWTLPAVALLAAGCGGAQPLSGVKAPRDAVRVGLLPVVDRRTDAQDGPGRGGRLHHAPSDAAADVQADILETLKATPALSVVLLPDGPRSAEALRAAGRDRALDLLLAVSLLEAGGTAAPRNDFSMEYLARVSFRLDWIDGGTGEVLVSADALAGEYGEIDEPPTLSAFDGERPASLVTRPASSWDRETRLQRLCRQAHDRALRRFRRSHRLWEALGMLEEKGRWP
jgi:hypothetical protein